MGRARGCNMQNVLRNCWKLDLGRLQCSSRYDTPPDLSVKHQLFSGLRRKSQGWFKPGLNHGLNRTGLFSKVHPGLLMDNWVDFSQISDYNIQENQA